VTSRTLLIQQWNKALRKDARKGVKLEELKEELKEQLVCYNAKN